MASGDRWLAHSARPQRDIPVQSYAAHIESVVGKRALPSLAAMLAFYCGPEARLKDRMRTALLWSTVFHDLGKLDDDNQTILRGLTGESLPYRHETAGALHCLERGQRAAAFAIHSHHQGLTNAAAERMEFCYQMEGEACRPFVRKGEYLKTSELLPQLLLRHGEALALQEHPLPDQPVQVLRWQVDKKKKKSHLTALEMRLLLSLLVDADHGDTAHHYGQEAVLNAPDPRWTERVEKLNRYVAGLGGLKASPRDPLRSAVYEDCVACDPRVQVYACDAPVGSGKTTAVMAYLLRAALLHNLRRIFVVVPFTNIIQQSVKVYRTALVLDGEDPEQVVAENHHVAEFQSPEARGLTTLWRAPIVVTTAVQFFETLASCAPARLRKLHALPGSSVFIDEAHAAMPLHLWPSMWDRLQELSTNWSCRFVLGSGSLPRLWESTRLFLPKTKAPSLMLQPKTIALGTVGEQNRVSFLPKPEPQTLTSLVEWLLKLKGARLVVMNTLQSAGALARQLADQGVKTLHLSTALTPAHRERTLAAATGLLTRQGHPEHGWVMVATSCIEAGVDISFDVALRERSSVSSLIQISGRVNRSGSAPRGEVWDFVAAADPAFTPNLALGASREVVAYAFANRLFESKAGDVMTIAIEEEFKRSPKETQISKLNTAEKIWEFSTVAEMSRLIPDETYTAVVDRDLLARLSARKPLRHTELVRGSISIREAVARRAGLSTLRGWGNDRLYVWPEGEYDYELLGAMKYLLTLKDISDQKFAMI